MKPSVKGCTSYVNGDACRLVGAEAHGIHGIMVVMQEIVYDIQSWRKRNTCVFSDLRKLDLRSYQLQSLCIGWR